MTGHVIALAKTESPAARALHDALKHELPWSVFYEFDDHLLGPLTDSPPNVIVIDMSEEEFKAARGRLARLRNAYPQSGLLVYSESTELSSLSFYLGITVAHNHLLTTMFNKRYSIARLALDAIDLAQTRARG